MSDTTYSSMTCHQLIATCKKRGIKGYSNKKKEELLQMIQTQEKKQEEAVKEVKEVEAVEAVEVEEKQPILGPVQQEIVCGDTLAFLPTLKSESAQIILADPPYNIGKDFGNQSDKQTMEGYLTWTEKWLVECLRILKPNGTMFVYGFSEILALILGRVPMNIHRRWIIWHYTNKNVASLNFWQRSHESILVLWKEGNVFHRDEVREAYTEQFVKGAAGKQRAATKGRFSKGAKTTTYTAHPNGALPRDVIKIPALAGGAGKKERVDHPTQKPLALCEKLLRSCQQPAAEGYVLIPFAGSGSECVAAKALGLPFIGVELNPAYVALIHQRLSQTEGVEVEAEAEAENGEEEASEETHPVPQEM